MIKNFMTMAESILMIVTLALAWGIANLIDLLYRAVGKRYIKEEDKMFPNYPFHE